MPPPLFAKRDNRQHISLRSGLLHLSSLLAQRYENGITFSRLSLTRCALLVALILGSVNVWGETITLDYNSFGLEGSYKSYTANVDGYSFTVEKGYKGSGNTIQMNNNTKGSPGYLYNTTPISGLKSITVTVASGSKTYTVYQGTSEQPLSNSAGTGSSTSTITFSSDQTYFLLKVSGASYFSSITITYESAGIGGGTGGDDASQTLTLQVNDANGGYVTNNFYYEEDGTTTLENVPANQNITLNAYSYTGYTFDKWVVSGTGRVANENSETTTFTMGTGASTVTAHFKADDSTPTLTASPTSIEFGSIEAGGLATKTVTITGANLTDEIEYIIDGPFEANGSESGTLQSTGDITITCTTTKVGTYSGTLLVSSTGATDLEIPISATIVAKPTITWHVNGTETSKQYSLGTTPTYDGPEITSNDCDDTKQFVGWATGAITQATDEIPEGITFYDKDATLPAVSGNATYYAVFATQDGEGGGTFTLSLVSNNTTYYVGGHTGSNTYLNAVTNENSAAEFRMESASSANSYYIYSVTDKTYIGGTGSDTKLTFSTTTSDTYVWVYNESEGTFKRGNNRYLGFNYNNGNNPRFTTYADSYAHKFTVSGGVSYSGYITQCCEKLGTPTFTGGQNEVNSDKTNEVTLVWTGDDYTGTGNSYTVIVYDENEVEVTRATDVKTTSCTIDRLSPATAYFWTVQAIGGEGYCNSDVSEQAYAETACTPNTLTINNSSCYVGDTYDFTDFISANSSADIIYTYDTENVVIEKTEEGRTTFYAINEGTYTITAVQAAEGDYCATPNADEENAVTFTITANAKACSTETTIVFNENAITKYWDDAVFTNVYETNNTGGEKTFTSNNSAVADVDASGNVTIKALGRAIITLSIGEDGDYCAGSESYTLTVIPRPLVKPASLQSDEPTQNSVNLSWGAVANADRYEVVVLDDNTNPAGTIVISGTTAEVTGLTANTHYSWYVTAVGSGNYASVDSEIAEFTTAPIPTYTVTWRYNGTEVAEGAWSSAEENKQVTALPNYTVDESESNGRVFKGWLAGTIDGELPTAPEGLFTTVEGSPVITGATTFYAVFATETTLNEGETEGWTEAEIGDINATDVVAITFKNATATYAMSNDQGTTKAPTAVKFTATGSDFTNAENIKWNISNNAGNLTICPNGKIDKWLYCTNENNGVRVGTSAENTFVIDSESGYLKNTDRTRYLGVYNNADVRCYTSPTTTNIKDQTLAFYKYSPGEHIEYSGYVTTSIEKTTTPTISPEGGIYTGTQIVTISCTDAAATIYYTTDGSDPRDKANTIVSGSTVTIKESCTLRVIAQKGSLSFSDEVIAEYTIKRIYNITWMNNGKEFHSATVNSDEALTDLPASDPTAPIGCYEKEFVGWATSIIDNPTNDTPTLIATADITTPTGTEDNITYYAVFADATLTGEYEDVDATIDLSKDTHITTSTEDELTFINSPLTLTSTRVVSSGTKANNYCPSSENSTRFYKSLSVEISAGGAELKTITITATSENYAAIFNNSDKWTNVSAAEASGETVTITPTAGATSVTFTPSGTCGATKISVTYKRAVKDYSAYTTSCDASEVVVETDKTLTVKEDATIGNLIVNAGATVEVEAGKTLEVTSVTLRSEGDKVPHLVLPSTNSKLVTADKTVTFTKWITHDRYYIFALPYDCKVSDIRFSDGTTPALGTNFLIKHYDGAARVENGGKKSSWVAVTASETLQAGKGYEVAVSYEAGKELVFPMALAHGNMHEHDNADKAFDYTAHGITSSTNATYAKDKTQCGWNLIGNPYFTNYAASGLGEWMLSIPEGKTYAQTLASAATLSPFSAFFIQAEEDGSLAFSKTAPRALLAPRFAPAERPVYAGISLSNGVRKDETTLVIGDQFTQDYEIGADLEKMLGLADKPQVYTIEGANKYAFKAINEQDAANANMLGVYLPAEGEYTFDVMEAYDLSGVQGVYLTDNVVLKTVNLMVEPYTFTNAQEHNTTRFALSVVRKPEATTDLGHVQATWSLWQDAPLHISVQGLMVGDVVRVIDATGKLVDQLTAGETTVAFDLPTAGGYCVQTIGVNGIQMKKIVVR